MKDAKEFDKDTALAILKDLSKRMYPDWDIFGKATLVISRSSFEEIRAKYLDGGEKNE